MTKFGAAENEMERLTAKFAQRTPTEHSLLGSGKFLAVRRQPYKSCCPPREKKEKGQNFKSILSLVIKTKLVQNVNRMSERQIEDRKTFQLSYQNKSC